MQKSGNIKKKKGLGILNTPLSLSDLLRFYDVVIPYFQDKWDDGIENEKRWTEAKNWTDAQVREIKSQNRQPYSFPIAVTKLLTISAAQKQTRTSFKVEAVSDPNDEIKAELAGLFIKDIEKRSKFKYVESEVFDSALGIKYGVSKINLDKSQYPPQIKIENVDYRRIVWDTNSRKYDLNEDALFMGELDYVYRYILESEGIDTSTISIGVANSFQGREPTQYFITPSKGEDRAYDKIAVINHYHKVIRKYYCVIFPDTQNLYNFTDTVVGEYRTKKEAEIKLRMLNVPYIERGIPFEGEVVEYEKLKLDRYKFVYNQIMEYEETELEKFPFNVFFAFKFQDKFASMMDFLKSSQIFWDRMFSQIDYSIGRGLKNVTTLNVNALAEGETPESAKQKAEITGGLITVNSNEKVFQNYDTSQANPQYFTILAQVKELMEDMAGGRSFQGLSEGANESGKSVMAKRLQGQLIAANFIDNLSRWKQLVGENLLWWIQHYTDAERTIKMQGGELSPEMLQLLQQNGIYSPSNQSVGGYLKINHNELSFLKNADLELLVTETDLSDTERQMKFLQYIELLKINPNLMNAPVFMQMLLETADISHEDKQKLIQWLNQQAQIQAQQQAQMQQQQAQSLQFQQANELAKRQLEDQSQKLDFRTNAAKILAGKYSNN